MKLTKTEQKILEALKTRKTITIHRLEKRNFLAACKLVAKGVLEVESTVRDLGGLHSRVFKLKTPKATSYENLGQTNEELAKNFW